MKKKITYLELCILNSIEPGLSLFERILLHILKKYSFKIYKIGFIDGFNLKE